MIKALSSQVELAEHLRLVGAKKLRRPVASPSWAKHLNDNEGFRRSLAGFIYNSVARNRFSFCQAPKRMILRKSWEAGIPEHLCPADYEAMTEEDKSDFRVAFRFSLPDMLLHSIVGAFVGQKLEGVLSKNCYAYRSSRGQPKAVREVRRLQARQAGWVVKLDVKSFNETVEHDLVRSALSKDVYPSLDAEERRVVEGTVEALLEFGQNATGRLGRGLVVGSGLTPPLTNLYLTTLDRYLETRCPDFVRYGDDLVAFCGTEDEAQGLLEGMKSVVDDLGQSTSSLSAVNPACCWSRGLRAVFKTDSDVEASIQAYARSSKCKTDIFHPGEPFDFIGFEFAGDKVFIRQETLGKIKRRLEQFTQRSKARIQAALEGGGRQHLGVIMDIEGDDVAIASVGYVKQAIQRVNSMLGFKQVRSTPKNGESDSLEFHPGYGFPWNVLKCVAYEDVKEQFRLLDAYAFGRLQRLASGFEGVGISVRAGQAPEPGFNFRGPVGHRDLRSMGLRTFKDVANRFDKDSER